jgi:hypothetical protein
VQELDVPDPTVEKLPGRQPPEPLTVEPAKQKKPDGHGMQTEEFEIMTNDPGAQLVQDAFLPLPEVE